MKTHQKPYVVCHMTTTVDGRIQPQTWPKTDLIHQVYEECHNKLKGDAWIIGRTSMEGFSSPRHKNLGKAKPTIKKADYVADPLAKRFAVVIDTAGKCRWDTNSISGDHIVEILTEKVSTAYLQHLQAKRVSYIFAGKKDVNLKMALGKLSTLFGIKRLLLEGGGVINGSFLKEGLIDELSQLVMPLADGTTGLRTLFEIENAPRSRKAASLKLQSVKKLKGGIIWLRYTL